MTDADDGAWWLAGDGQWHEGTPPSGWVQAGDRRWYPYEPPETAEGYARKIESARLRTATVLTAGQSPDPVDYADGDGDYDTYGYDYDDEDDGLAWSSDYRSDYPADDLDYDEDGSEDERRRPAWLMVGVLVALLFVAIGVVGVMAQTNDRTDGEAGPAVETAPSSSTPSSSTTTSTTATTGGQPSPAVTAAPPSTSPPTTAPRATTTTVPPRPSTTAPPPTTTVPPSTTSTTGGPPVRVNGPCSNVGATAVTSDGTPVTCRTTTCDGNSSPPRWRPTSC